MSVVVVVVVVVVVNSLVSHVISHVLAMVTDSPSLVDRFMLRVYSLSEYLLKYVTFSLFHLLPFLCNHRCGPHYGHVLMSLSVCLCLFEKL